MKDLINISEEELREMSYDDPYILDELVIDSGLGLDELAEVFVKHPILQDSILRISDPVELYNAIYGDQVTDANPIDYEYDRGYEKIKAEYIKALEYIKKYVNEHSYEYSYEYKGSTIQQIIENAPVEVEDWDDPYQTGWKEKLEVEKRNKKLLDEILKNPDRMDVVFRSKPVFYLLDLYDALKSELLPDSVIFDDAEMYHNSVIKEALEKLSRDYLHEELDYGYLDSYEEEPEITTEDLTEADKELEEFYTEHPEMDNRPDSQIPEGMSVEEYSEAMGVHINEFGEIIRPQKSIEQDEELMAWLNGSKMSPLKTREEQLSKLEKEAKTISEAEALIDKQTEKEGQDIGE